MHSFIHSFFGLFVYLRIGRERRADWASKSRAKMDTDARTEYCVRRAPLQLEYVLLLRVFRKRYMIV